MKYHNYTTEELIEKLKTANREIVLLKQEQQIKLDIEKEKSKIEHVLRERIKELNCLYGVAEIIEANENNVDAIAKGILDLIPTSWQYPEITAAQIKIRNKPYCTSEFRESPWKQSADIFESEEKVGFIEICYLEEMPPIDEGPFLREERLLINAISVRIGNAIERITSKKQLEIEQKSLQNANITLKEVLSKVKEEQTETGKAINANVNKTIIPLLHALSSEVYPEQQRYIDLIHRGLEDIVSPFINKLSEAFMALTPVEIQICNMIRNGLSTKEIADLRHISGATVSRHRENIRQKLELKNCKVNLPTFLRTHMAE
jgi:regulatory LuxR family protein